MTDTARTAQELADEGRRLAFVLRCRIDRVGTPDDLWERDWPDIDPYAARAADLLESLAALASQAEPVCQTVELEKLAREIVKLHKERGCVLTAHVEQMADLLAGQPAPSVEAQVDLPHGVTFDQVRTLLGWPQMLRLLADYHSWQETEADAIDPEFFAGCVKYHAERREFFRAEADRIEKEHDNG